MHFWQNICYFQPFIFIHVQLMQEIFIFDFKFSFWGKKNTDKFWLSFLLSMLSLKCNSDLKWMLMWSIGFYVVYFSIPQITGTISSSIKITCPCNSASFISYFLQLAYQINIKYQESKIYTWSLTQTICECHCYTAYRC